MDDRVSIISFSYPCSDYMRVFIQNLNTLLGKELIACFAEGGHTIVGTLLQASNDDHAAIITASSGVEWKLNDGEKPKFVSEIVESATEAEAIVTAASSCDVIILDLALQPALCGAVVGALSTASSAWDAKKTVVAVSSILTWARTPTEAVSTCFSSPFHPGGKELGRGEGGSEGVA